MEEQEKTETKNNQQEERHWGYRRHSGRWAMLVVGLLLLIAIFAFGVMLGGVRGRLAGPPKISISRSEMPFNAGGRGFGGGGFGRFSSNQNMVSGTVTSISGSTWAVAGDGKTNTVTTNSSTQYVNGSGVAVNDTVEVSGSLSGNTFTASRVVINP